MRDIGWHDARFAAWKTSPPVPQAMQRAREDLETYYQQPIDAITQRYWGARDHAEQPALDSHSLEAVYQATEQYIYESTYFECLEEYQSYYEILRAACVQFKRVPVLDFGGGAGGLTLALASAGLPCDYADIPGSTATYAAWRFRQHGCSVTVLDATQPLPVERYGAIITMDVFEHLPDLRATLVALSTALKPGGWLITRSTFADGDPLHLPQNLLYADIRVFNQLLESCGFRYRGRLRADSLSEWRLKHWSTSRAWRMWLDPKLKFGGRFVVHEKC